MTVFWAYATLSSTVATVTWLVSREPLDDWALWEREFAGGLSRYRIMPGQYRFGRQRKAPTSS